MWRINKFFSVFSDNLWRFVLFHRRSRDLFERVRVGHVLVDIQPAPAPLHGVVMLPVKRNARAHDLHVARPVFCKRLAGAERHAVLFLEFDFLLKQEINELLIGAELIPEGVDDGPEQEFQVLFS
jgi:hypothetical protein